MRENERATMVVQRNKTRSEKLNSINIQHEEEEEGETHR